MGEPLIFSRVSQCDGKAKFHTKAYAKARARQVETMHGGGRLDVYRCPYCSGWHLGHRPPREVIRYQRD